MMLGGMVQFQLDDNDYVLKGVGGWGLGVNTKMNMFWHERSAFQRSAFGRSTAGNDVVATVIIRIGPSVRRSSGRRSGGQLLAMT